MDGRAYYKLSDGKLIGVSNRTDRKILVFFLVRFGIIAYLCIRTSALCLGGGAGATSLEIKRSVMLVLRSET